MLVMEEQLEGVLLMTGRYGEYLWTTVKSEIHPHLRSPTSLAMSGATLVELRLRTGFIHLPLPYSGAVHAEAIYGITMHREMIPWKIGGQYDRPIARRIIEEAGVPRKLFGLHKKGGGWSLTPLLSRTSKISFDEFYHCKVHEHNDINIYKKVTMNLRSVTGRWTHQLERKALRHRNIDAIIPLHVLDRLHLLWGSKYLYGFHWGFAQIENRYKTPWNKGYE